MAAVQCVLSPQSPKLAPNEDEWDGMSALFVAVWMAHVLTPTLLTLLAFARNDPTKGRRSLPSLSPSLTLPSLSPSRNDPTKGRRSLPFHSPSLSPH